MLTVCFLNRLFNLCVFLCLCIQHYKVGIFNRSVIVNFLVFNLHMLALDTQLYTLMVQNFMTLFWVMLSPAKVTKFFSSESS